MNALPLELINIIANNIQKITDKRQFTQTCKAYNNLMKPKIKKQELAFEEYYKKKESKNLGIKINHLECSRNNYIAKFTIELCNDSYFDKIPNRYLTPKNNIIVKTLTIYGQIKLLTRAIDNGCKLFKKHKYKYNIFDSLSFNNNSCEHAILSGEIDVLKFVKSKGCLWDSGTADFAAGCGHLHILKFIVKNGCKPSAYATSAAAKGGYSDILDWLLINNYKMDYYLYRNAILGGSLPCLQLAIQNGCFFDVSDAYLAAARWNHLHMIIWLRDNGYKWGSKTSMGAVIGNHLELLKWLVKEGCKLDSKSYIAASNEKNTEILKWLIENNCPRKP